MAPQERDRLVGAQSSSGGLDGFSKPAPKVNKGRGVLCWATFGAFLVFFLIMTIVYTDPKRYKAATPLSYLSGEEAILYKGLGQVFFVPTTRKQNALATFQLGLQLLHMFWYDLALEKFIEARTMDPKLGMAYWGEAMCYKQPLWQTEDVAAAQAALARMDKAVLVSTLTDRERDYIRAVRGVFAANTSLQQREVIYADRMLELQDTYQSDPDACAFAALAQLGKLHSLGNYLLPDEAGDVRYEAEELLGECTHFYPKHAGLLSYQVYLYDIDNTAEAAKGMAPALALAALAPASSRAQHMRSHIALRFGNWSQVVDSNKAAVAASDSYCTAAKAGNDCDADNRWHALEWQLYGQTQQCAIAAATVSYKRMQSVAASQNYTGDYVQWLYRTFSHLQLQSLGSWGAVPLRNSTDNATAMMPMPLYDTKAIQDAEDIGDHFWPPHAEAHALLARVSALLVGRNATQQAAPAVQAAVGAALARLDAIVAAQAALVAAAANSSSSAAAAAANSEMAALLMTVKLQARALVDASACAAAPAAPQCATWGPMMDAALALHNSFAGSATLPSLKIAPTPEFYGNLLLSTLASANVSTANATAAARTAAAAANATALFTTCLQQLPGRMQCVLGLARAARARGDTAAALSAYRTLSGQCAGGDARHPALLEARAALAMSVSPPPPVKAGGAGKGRRLRRAL